MMARKRGDAGAAPRDSTLPGRCPVGMPANAAYVVRDTAWLAGSMVFGVIFFRGIAGIVFHGARKTAEDRRRDRAGRRRAR